MSFDLTDLLTLIVRAHDRHKVKMGKVMRVALQAAAGGQFLLYTSDGCRLDVNSLDHSWLLNHAANAERQAEVRWWTKGSWTNLRTVLVNEPEFWKCVINAFGTDEQKKAGISTPGLGKAIARLLKGGNQPPQTISWSNFCDLVRDQSGGWESKRDGRPNRGFSNKTITRIVKNQKKANT
jgi:hypothetical protein